MLNVGRNTSKIMNKYIEFSKLEFDKIISMSTVKLIMNGSTISYINWCNDNCFGLWTYRAIGVFCFELQQDAVQFKLKFN